MADRPDPIKPSRRGFLGALALGAAWALAAPKAAWAFFTRWFPIRTVEIEDFRFDPTTGELVRKGGGRQPYALIVDGLVESPRRLSYADLKALPQVEQTSDFHCVEGWSVADVRWGGIRLAALTALARPKPEARYVILHGLGRTRHKPGGFDHYVESFPMEKALDPAQGWLLALCQGGEPLSHEHGAPLRAVSPLDLAYKSTKYVGRVEFSDKPQPGWWTMANPAYPIDAPVPPRRLRP